MTFQIVAINSIAEAALDELEGEHFVLAEKRIGPKTQAILVRSQDLKEIEIPQSVEVIARAGSGVNNIPVTQLSARGVPVFNAPGANANAVAELTMLGMGMAARNIVPAIAFAQDLPLDAGLENAVEAGKKQFAGIELKGHTLGVIGLGAIGGIVAEKALQAGMRVVGYDPELTLKRAISLPQELELAESLEDLLAICEFISLHIPLIEGERGTRDYIGTSEVELMASGSILLNFSRGEIVADEAIEKGLDRGILRTYVSDFPSPTFTHNPRVISMPHLGASTEEAEENSAVMVVRQLKDYLVNGNIINAVNFPNISMPRRTPHRLSVATTNIPGMIAKVTAVLGSSINIEGVDDRSRGDMAYNLFDIDSPVNEATLEQLHSIYGVLRARYLPKL